MLLSIVVEDIMAPKKIAAKGKAAASDGITKAFTRGSQMTELKPCPFCGSPVVDLIHTREGIRPQCLTCGAASACGEDHEQAAEAWNTRALPDPPEEE